MRIANLAPGDEPPQIRRDFHLPGMRTRRVDALKAVKLSRADQAKVVRENAARLLRLR